MTSYGIVNKENNPSIKSLISHTSHTIVYHPEYSTKLSLKYSLNVSRSWDLTKST